MTDASGAIDAALAPDEEETAALRALWLALAGPLVWGGLESPRLGALPKLRRRVLELGERLASLAQPPAWLPGPRARLKSALATALAAREALAQCEQARADLGPGGERAAFDAAWQALSAQVERSLDARCARWATMLETLESDEHDD